MTAERTTIGVLLFDGVEELDAVGPWEVFRGAEEARPEALHCFTVAQTAQAVKRQRIAPASVYVRTIRIGTRSIIDRAPPMSASGLPSDFVRKGLLLLRGGYV